MWRDKIQIYQECWKPVSKTRQDEQHVSVGPSPVSSTHRFFRIHKVYLIAWAYAILKGQCHKKSFQTETVGV